MEPTVSAAKTSPRSSGSRYRGAHCSTGSTLNTNRFSASSETDCRLIFSEKKLPELGERCLSFEISFHLSADRVRHWPRQRKQANARHKHRRQISSRQTMDGRREAEYPHNTLLHFV
jgi:hypothetical protein